MPTRNVNLTDELDRFLLTKVKSGRYENASEVVRAALRTLEREEQQYEAKLAALRAAIDEGDAAGLPRATYSRVLARRSSFPGHGANRWLGFVFRVMPKPTARHRPLHPYNLG